MTEIDISECLIKEDRRQEQVPILSLPTEALTRRKETHPYNLKPVLLGVKEGIGKGEEIEIAGIRYKVLSECIAKNPPYLVYSVTEVPPF